MLVGRRPFVCRYLLPDTPGLSLEVQDFVRRRRRLLVIFAHVHRLCSSGKRSGLLLDLVHSTFTVKECRRFFKCQALCLNNEGVAIDEFESDPATEHDLPCRLVINMKAARTERTYVVLPSEFTESDGIDILVEDQGQGH